MLPAVKSFDFALFEAGSWTIPLFPCCFNCLEPRCEATKGSAASAHLGGKARERVLDCAGRHVGAEQSHAQTLQQDEMDAPLPCLLIDAHHLLHAPRGEPFCGCRKSCALKQRTDAGRIGLREEAKLTRQVGRHDHPGCYGLAVQPNSVAEARFDGVAEGMPEVQQHAQAALALV